MARRKNKHKQRNRHSKNASQLSAEVKPTRTTGLMIGAVAGLLVLAMVAYLVLGGRTQAPEETVSQTGAEQAVFASLPIAPNIDALAPDFTLADINGNEVSLSDYRGKPIVVTFFHTW